MTPGGIDRRDFLRMAGGASIALTAGGLLAACGGDDSNDSEAAAATTAKSGEMRKVKLGFIALTDCASLVMAKELGYFSERGLDVTLEKQASWPVTRDNLLNGQIDGAHCLFGMPLAVASGVGGGAPSTALKIAMVLNNNGQAITLSKDMPTPYGDLAKAKAVLEKKSPTLAMTFPGGTHDIWLRYWLRATGVDESKVKIIPIPPPQMVANMKVGTMDGYCVGEPWPAVAVNDGIGFTHIATQDIWKHHPEKALVVSEKFSAQTDTLKDVMAAVLKASKWLDNLTNRAKAATTIGAPGYVNAPATQIEGRLLGKYDLGGGLGSKTFTDDYMLYFNDGKVNSPRRAHAHWFLAQYERLGLIKSAPAATQIVDSIVLRDLYEEVADAEKIDVPDDDMKSFDVKLDNATFDPKKPEEEVKRAA